MNTTTYLRKQNLENDQNQANIRVDAGKPNAESGDSHDLPQIMVSRALRSESLKPASSSTLFEQTSPDAFRLSLFGPQHSPFLAISDLAVRPFTFFGHSSQRF